MGAPPKPDKPFDPIEAWRAMRDAGLEAWSRTMEQTVNSEEDARATGAMLDSCLAASAPARDAMQSLMLAALQQLQMPSRSEVASLAERLTSVEMKLDDLDAKMDAILSALGHPEGK